MIEIHEANRAAAAAAAIVFGLAGILQLLTLRQPEQLGAITALARAMTSLGLMLLALAFTT